MPQGFLEIQSISVSFGSLKALDDVSLQFSPGEVHAVVGENGAGKSTLMNVLGGFLKPTSGLVGLDGQRLPGSAVEHRKRGVEMVHQHFRLVPQMSVEGNLRLALLRSGKSVEDALVIAKSLGWELPLKRICADLGVGEKQRVEILKALSSNPQVIIFDEPTAVLSESEVDSLLGTLRRLANEGKTVILIAHKLAEVFSVSDRISVLRGGTLRGSFAATEANPKQISELMVGDQVSLGAVSDTAFTDKFLVSNLEVEGECPITDISFEVGFGEVLGIGGVDGNGQVELAEALAHVRSSRGQMTHLESVGYVPQDRQVDGLALSMSIDENLSMAHPSVGGSTAIREFEIKAEGPNVAVKALSGGNQQKVVLARELGRNPKLLVAVNPTRGLDVRASSFVLQRIRETANRGAAVVLISTDPAELNAISNRVRYIGRGKLFDSAQEALTG